MDSQTQEHTLSQSAVQTAADLETGINQRTLAAAVADISREREQAPASFAAYLTEVNKLAHEKHLIPDDAEVVDNPNALNLLSITTSNGHRTVSLNAAGELAKSEVSQKLTPASPGLFAPQFGHYSPLGPPGLGELAPGQKVDAGSQRQEPVSGAEANLQVKSRAVTEQHNPDGSVTFQYTGELYSAYDRERVHSLRPLVYGEHVPDDSFTGSETIDKDGKLLSRHVEYGTVKAERKWAAYLDSDHSFYGGEDRTIRVPSLYEGNRPDELTGTDIKSVDAKFNARTGAYDVKVRDLASGNLPARDISIKADDDLAKFGGRCAAELNNGRGIVPQADAETGAIKLDEVRSEPIPIKRDENGYVTEVHGQYVRQFERDKEGKIVKYVTDGLDKDQADSWLTDVTYQRQAGDLWKVSSSSRPDTYFHGDISVDDGGNVYLKSQAGTDVQRANGVRLWLDQNNRISQYESWNGHRVPYPGSQKQAGDDGGQGQNGYLPLTLIIDDEHKCEGDKWNSLSQQMTGK